MLVDIKENIKLLDYCVKIKSTVYCCMLRRGTCHLALALAQLQAHTQCDWHLTALTGCCYLIESNYHPQDRLQHLRKR